MVNDDLRQHMGSVEQVKELAKNKMNANTESLVWSKWNGFHIGNKVLVSTNIDKRNANLLLEFINTPKSPSEQDKL